MKTNEKPATITPMHAQAPVTHGPQTIKPNHIADLVRVIPASEVQERTVRDTEEKTEK